MFCIYDTFQTIRQMCLLSNGTRIVSILIGSCDCKQDATIFTFVFKLRMGFVLYLINASRAWKHFILVQSWGQSRSSSSSSSSHTPSGHVRVSYVQVPYRFDIPRVDSFPRITQFPSVRPMAHADAHDSVVLWNEQLSSGV